MRLFDTAAARLRARAWSLLAGGAGWRAAHRPRTRRRSRSASPRRGRPRRRAGCRPQPASSRRSAAPPLPGAENAGKPGYYTVKPGDTLIRIGLDTGQNWRDIARWNGLEQPQRHRGRPGAARGAAGGRSGGQPCRPVAPTRAAWRRGRSTARPLGGSAASARRVRGVRAVPAAGAAPAAPRSAARDPDERPGLGLARRRPGRGGLRRQQEQGPGDHRQGRRPGAGRGRRPRRLRRLGPARLRQPGHRQAQHHLPHGLRAQPDAAGQGRPGRCAAARRSPRWVRATPSGCSCTSRSAARAGRSIRRSCCRHGDAAAGVGAPGCARARARVAAATRLAQDNRRP